MGNPQSGVRLQLNRWSETAVPAEQMPVAFVLPSAGGDQQDELPEFALPEVGTHPG